MALLKSIKALYCLKYLQQPFTPNMIFDVYAEKNPVIVVYQKKKKIYALPFHKIGQCSCYWKNRHMAVSNLSAQWPKIAKI